MGAVSATFAVTVYLVLGMIGLPVFSGFTAGFGHLVGPTGGFLLGYIPYALICGLSNKRKIVPRIVLFLCATLVLYFAGTVWYVFWADVSPMAALSACVMPTIPGDVLKIIAATVITKRVGDAP